jgi:uncharacterized protein with PIN domain
MAKGIKLVADAMLGRLAKFLRILGYDTAYLVNTDDYAVMRVARAEGRLILTRDRQLARRRGVRALLIESQELEDQLRQVRDTLGLPREAPRCPVCNEQLVDAPPETVAARVPPYVQRTQTQFSLCMGCERIYWPGTHWEHMQEFIGELQDRAGSDKIGAA